MQRDIPIDVTLGIPCRADEPGLGETLESLFVACRHRAFSAGLTAEVVICINGLKGGAECRPLAAAREVCAHQGIPIREIWLSSSSSMREEGTSDPRQEKKSFSGEGPMALQYCTVLLTEQWGKPRAWNQIWKQARGAVVLFCDADVRIEEDAVSALYARLRRDSHLSLVAAREVPVLAGGGTLWSRMGAIPYRFDFGNIGGRLYLIRKDARSEPMPEDLLLEDAWLTVAVGRPRVAKELRAQVFFLPPATWRDYFAERVRTEGGKLQIRRVHGALLAHGPIARYHWWQFWQEIPFREYPLVVLALGVRSLARVWAWMALSRKHFYALYRPFSSTKGWMSAQR